MKAMMSTLVVLAFLALASAHDIQEDQNLPPHCTVFTKKSDLTAPYRIDYPDITIPTGKREYLQPLRCTNPSGVGYALAKVCDWAAAPVIVFTMSDEYLHIYRQDPAGKFAGEAVVKIYQTCNRQANSH